MRYKSLKMVAQSLMTWQIALLATLFLFVSGCSTNSGDGGQVMQPQTTSTVTFAGQPIPSVNTTTFDILPTDHLLVSHLMTDVEAKTSQAMLGKLADYFSGDIDQVSETPRFLMLYTSKSYSTIDLADILGISVFMVEGNGLNHKFYKVSGTQANEDIRFSGYTDFFKISTPGLLSSVVFGQNPVKWAMFTVKNIVSSQPKDLAKSSVESIFPRNDALLGRVLDETSSLLVAESGCSQCGGGGERCEPNPIDNPCNGLADPELPGCSSIIIAGVLSKGIVKANSKIDVSVGKAYAFRDSFLSKSSKGRDYIGFYYKIAELGLAKGAINLKTIQQHVDFAAEVHKVAETLQNGNSTELVVTDSFYRDALTMINYYQSLSKNEEYGNILDQIKADLAQYKGKNRAQVLSTVQ